jgi:hypothetical protein
VLPHEDLAPWYEKAVWLYVCRTWREDEPDLEAARIHDRFGVTSWPHLFLIHPQDDRILERAGRTTALIDRAFAPAASQVEPLSQDEAGPAIDAVRAARQRVLALEALGREATPAEAEEALGALEDPDVLVRHRALRVLSGRDEPALADHAEALLVEGNDAIRFELLDWIERNRVSALTPLLVRVFADAGGRIPSGNPNVLRGRAAACLGACGDARAIDGLAPIARAAEARNSTTRVVVEALGALGARGDATAKTRVTEVLLASWPAAVKPAANSSPSVAGRYALRLAEAVTQALGATLGTVDLPDPPAGWSQAQRAAHVEAVTAWVRDASGG